MAAEPGSAGPHVYRVELTQQDVEAIRFSGYRYGWSDALTVDGPGTLELSEPEAWKWSEAVDQDTEGGHSRFPLLSPESDLYRKLVELYESIV